jgi:uncharacterized protein (TIGR03118 family)
MNPWGVSFSGTSPFWVSDQVNNVATLYNASGIPTPLIVSTPGGPTGQVFNPTTGFLIGGAAPATFIFATLSGNIEAWNGAQGTTAAIVAPSIGGVYTGLTMGTLNGNNMLYVANKAAGNIVVFNSSFQQVQLGGGAFVDPSVPTGLTPYNIQNIGGNLYVEYSGPTGTGGVVAVFDTAGNLLQSITDSHLDAPWGVTLAPTGFGTFGGDLLVGNFGSGTIDAFDPVTGAFAGVLTDSSGNPIVNSGLWALEFRTPVAGNANTGSSAASLFFTAGIDRQADGLFGRIDPAVPEPGTLATAGLVFAGAFCVRALRKTP